MNEKFKEITILNSGKEVKNKPSMETIKFTSQHKVVISETESDTLDAKFIICDFEVNGNNTALTRDTIDSWIDTLLYKPVVGKVLATSNGSDFTGHNVKIVKKKDEQGNTYQEVEFDTSSFGTFYKVEIETIDNKEYIVAYAKLWKRFSQAYAVIKRRMESEEGIKTSWEVQVLESHKETQNGKNIKYIDKGVFIGHALLGSSVQPAYPSSGLLSVASNNDNDAELIEALLSDIEISTKEELDLPDKNTTTVSALSTRDLRQKISEALNPKGWNSNPYYSIWEVYPENHKILAYDIDRDTEDDYISISYSVDAENDTITIGDKVNKKLSTLIAEKTSVNINVDLNDTAKLLSAKETENKALSSQLQEVSSELESKTDALVKAGVKIAQLENEVSELKPFKEKVEAAELEKQEAEIAEKKASLKELASTGGYISQDEVETSEEIGKLIDELDEKGIKALIAERMMQKLSEQKDDEIEVSSNNKNAKTNITVDEDVVDPTKIMASFLYN